MGINCRIIKNQDGSVEYVEALNGNRSVLYDNLRIMVGEQPALDYYALTEAESFKDVVEAKEEVVQNNIIVSENTKLHFKDRINPINDKSTGEIELELVQTVGESRKGGARRVIEKFLRYTDKIGKDVYLTVSPRTKETTEAGLIKLYKSFGFTLEKSGFEMKRKAKKAPSDLLDKNGEVNVETVLNYANSSEKKLTKEQTIEAINTAVAFGVKNSAELSKLLEDAFLEEGLVIFNKNKLSKAGYSDFEVTKILSDDSIQKSIKQNISKIRNTTFEIDYDENQVENKSKSINFLGKLEVENPYITEKNKLPQQNIKTIKDGEIQDKTSDTLELLRKTYPIEITPVTEDLDIMFGAIENSNEVIANENFDKVVKIVKGIKKDVVDYGIDLKDIDKRLFPISKLKQFITELKNYLNNPNDNFAQVYDNFFELTSPLTKGIREALDENDILLETELSEYELFRDHNLIRRYKDIYVQVSPMENMFDTFVNIQDQIKSIEEVQSKIIELEVEDFEVESKILENMWMWKKYFGTPLKTVSNSKPDYIDIREAVNNPYKKVTLNGVQLINNDIITKTNSNLMEGEKELPLLDSEVDINLEKRKIALQNRESVEKIKTDYTYVEDEVLLTKDNIEQFVRTPQGIFEKVFEDGNLNFYKQVAQEQKNLTNLDFSNFNYLQTSEESWIQAKKYYTKEELKEIEDKFFNC